MPGPTPPNVPLSEAERAELQVLVRAQKTSQHIALRARIILLLADGLTAPAVARRLQTTRTTVRLWRRRWLEGAATTVLARLQDDPRPGAPLTFSAEQWCQIMALACEPPEQSERPISHWTPRELAEEAVTRQCVASISTRHVGRFLKSGGVKTPSQPVLAQCGPGPRGRDEDR
jgi:transposase